jgi:hypothetical protein
MRTLQEAEKKDSIKSQPQVGWRQTWTTKPGKKASADRESRSILTS